MCAFIGHLLINIIFWGSNHVVASSNNSFSILSQYSIAWLCNNSSILFWGFFLVNQNSAAMKFYANVPWYRYSDKYLGVELQNYTVFVVTYSEYCQLFSKMVVPIYTSLFSSWELQLLHMLISIDTLFPHFTHFDVCAVGLHCVLNFKASKLMILKYMYIY